MKKVYIAPEIIVICGVCEPLLTRASEDVETKDNNNLNGGGTFGDENLGVNYGEDHTGGGNLNTGDLE